MRPPVPVPTLSRRAKLVLGAVAVLLVLFTAIGTLTNVYVDYLWFDETDYTDVFWAELQTRALLFAGFTAQGSWQTWLTFRNSTNFGRTDPEFDIDISFFVFDYPFYRLLLGFGFAIVLLALIGSLLTHYVFGGVRLQTPRQKLTSAARG